MKNPCMCVCVCVCVRLRGASATWNSFHAGEGVLSDTNLFEANTFEFMAVCFLSRMPQKCQWEQLGAGSLVPYL